jgi:hypothetical protein
MTNFATSETLQVHEESLRYIHHSSFHCLVNSRPRLNCPTPASSADHNHRTGKLGIHKFLSEVTCLLRKL